MTVGKPSQHVYGYRQQRVWSFFRPQVRTRRQRPFEYRRRRPIAVSQVYFVAGGGPKRTTVGIQASISTCRAARPGSPAGRAPTFTARRQSVQSNRHNRNSTNGLAPPRFRLDRRPARSRWSAYSFPRTGRDASQATKSEAVHGAEDHSDSAVFARRQQHRGPAEGGRRPEADGRGHLTANRPARARSPSRTETPGAGLYHPSRATYKDLDDGAWTTQSRQHHCGVSWSGPGTRLARSRLGQGHDELRDDGRLRPLHVVELPRGRGLGHRRPHLLRDRAAPGWARRRNASKYSTAPSTAPRPRPTADYAGGTRSFFFEPGDFEYDDAYDWYEATKTRDASHPPRHQRRGQRVVPAAPREGGKQRARGRVRHRPRDQGGLVHAGLDLQRQGHHRRQ